MKKFFLIILIITISIDASYRVVNVDNNDVLNVREYANAKSKKIGQLAFNTLNIEVIECKQISKYSNWCKIQYNLNNIGWVNKRYLSFYEREEEYYTNYGKEEDTNTDDTNTIIFFIVIIALIVWVRGGRKRKLMSKYNDKEIVNKIMKGTFWKDGTNEMLLDALGKPKEIEQKVFKSKVKEVWKYYQVGKNSFKLKVILENNIIVGWTEKGIGDS